jgi:hypothetical protein
VSDIPDRASIHREWARDAEQYLGHDRTEATFRARDWQRLYVRCPSNLFGERLGTWLEMLLTISELRLVLSFYKVET